MQDLASDHPERARAIHPASSFIVQAPAGSGKTELLMQRYLALLAQACEAPEEITAITFTRKAASEMRERILAALCAARDESPPSEPHHQARWQLAKKALARDAEKQWDLLSNPHRLRIMTIDSLSANLSQRMPILSKFGSTHCICDDPLPYYQQAVDEILNDSTGTQRGALDTLCLHLDNHQPLIEKLLIEMLRHRDQWLPHIAGQHDPHALRCLMEEGLKTVNEEALAQCETLFTAPIKSELYILLLFAAEQVEADHPLSAWMALGHFPTGSMDGLHHWHTLASTLLTKDFKWRRSIDKRLGFPTATSTNKSDAAYFSSMKKRMLSVIDTLRDNAPLQKALADLLQAPPLHYNDPQWNVVVALLEVLPILAAKLSVIFAENGLVDFIEMSHGALHALGDDEAPSDLALYLDHQLKHLLVDEFQDTSLTQFRLLERLTRGWENDDGRTLFLVGDPMQSIYRFRQAEVGLFLRARQEGINDIQLESLILTNNFRSTPHVVSCLNDSFEKIFPDKNHIATGAISFTPSDSGKTPDANIDSTVALKMDTDSHSSAQRLVDLIQNEKQHTPNSSIAILVRSRSHLINIIPALQAAGIIYQAVDIDPLQNNSHIKDLIALTQALSHTADRAAWLSILRAPWCGLSLDDLLALVKEDLDAPIFRQLQRYQQRPLSDKGKQSIDTILPILSDALSQRFRMPLSQWIRKTWQALNGPRLITGLHERNQVDRYFELLDELDKAGTLIDTALLLEKVNREYANAESNDPHAVQIMTIHKSKGLEFDMVIIPELQRASATDAYQLLLWWDRPREHMGTDLLLAPLHNTPHAPDPIYQYLRRQNHIKAQHEMARLLYVAATRAKHRLYLLATETDRLPQDSLLATWDPELR